VFCGAVHFLAFIFDKLGYVTFLNLVTSSVSATRLELSPMKMLYQSLLQQLVGPGYECISVWHEVQENFLGPRPTSGLFP